MQHSFRRTVVIGLAVAGSVVPGALAVGGTASAQPSDLVSCTLTPATATWESPDDVTPIVVEGTPDEGESAFSASVVPDGGTRVVVGDNFGNPGGTPPDGFDVVMGMDLTYDMLLEALGGKTGTVYLRIYVPTATDVDDPHLCEAVITLVAPAEESATTTTVVTPTLPVSGSNNGMLLWLAVLLLVVGVPVTLATRRR